MTLLIADGADNQFQKVYSRFSTVTWSATEGVYGNGAFYVPYSSTVPTWGGGTNPFIAFNWATVGAPTTPRTVRLSFWIRASVALSTITAAKWINFYRPSSTSGYDQNWIGLNSPTSWYFDSAYSVPGQTFGTVSTTPLNILDGKWHHVFLAARYGNLSTGLFKLKIDDRNYFNLTGDTIAFSGDESTPAGVYFFNIQTATVGGYYLDDIVIWDSADTGDGFTDIDLPPQRVFTLRPSADTAQAQSYPSVGSARWSILDQVDANASNGVITLEPGKSDLYEFDNLSANANVRAIVVNMAFASGNVGTRANARIILSTNNVNVVGNTYQTQSYSINNPYMENWTVYPSAAHSNNKFAYISLRDFGNGSIAWAQTSINGLQIGIENTGVP